MDFFAILEMAGGLALFLYGMDTMARGLSAFSGERMKRLLMCFIHNRLTAVLVGALVTAVIQSSSTATVMVVGLVNAGLMNLSQAVGVIMGANVGTTATAWLFGIAGIEEDTFLLKLIKPASFSPVFAVVGIILLLTAREERKKKVGTVVMGFAVLMTGMETMCRAAAPMAEDPEVLELLGLVTHPVAGVIMGAALTAVLQSSSASIGMLQVLCKMGVLHYDAVIPIIMGQNIGTCISAMLAGIGTSKNAKRAAAIHLYFNVIGTACFLGVYFFVKLIFSPAVLETAAEPFSIAAIHTLYNVFAVVLLFPWAGVLERLSTAVIP